MEPNVRNMKLKGALSSENCTILHTTRRDDTRRETETLHRRGNVRASVHEIQRDRGRGLLFNRKVATFRRGDRNNVEDCWRGQAAELEKAKIKTNMIKQRDGQYGELSERIPVLRPSRKKTVGWLGRGNFSKRTGFLDCFYQNSACAELRKKTHNNAWSNCSWRDGAQMVVPRVAMVCEIDIESA